MDSAVWITVKEAANRLGCATESVRVMAERGKVGHRIHSRRMEVCEEDVRNLETLNAVAHSNSVTIREASRLTGMPYVTLRGMVATGKLRCCRDATGRVRINTDSLKSVASEYVGRHRRVVETCVNFLNGAIRVE